MAILDFLKVMLAADTVEFKKGMRTAASEATLFENSFGQRSTLIERHGQRLINTSNAIVYGMQRMKTDGIGAITDLAGAAGFEKLAIAVGIGALAYTEYKGVVEGAMQSVKTARAPVFELAEALAGNPEKFAAAVAQYDALRKAVGAMGPEYNVATERTHENAAALINATDMLFAEAKARRIAGAELASHQQKYAALVPVADQVVNAMWRGREEMRRFGEDTRAALGVWNEKDVLDKSAALEAQIKAIARSGGSATQTVAALGSQFSDVAKVAAELGVSLSPSFERMAEAVAAGPGEAMDSLFAQFKNTPVEVSKSTAASAAALAGMGETLKGSISGGFGQGIKDGISFGEQQLATWREKVAGDMWTIRVQFDAEALAAQLKAMGLKPQAPGAGI